MLFRVSCAMRDFFQLAFGNPTDVFARDEARRVNATLSRWQEAGYIKKTPACK